MTTFIQKRKKERERKAYVKWSDLKRINNATINFKTNRRSRKKP